MGATKIELFSKKHLQIAAMAKALGHPARIAILQNLAKSDSCICGDLVEELGLAQATISQHLKELKAVGLVQGTIEGTSVCYCIDPVIWKEYADVFKNFFTTKISNSKCC
ncbi:MAG: metalloregulator ArsR/SmtB family transcription factor [Bacteroidota bacterium]|nr:metalloregulator ArsR/SmtB family transcription factor [Bacteroidota bacterium]